VCHHRPNPGNDAGLRLQEVMASTLFPPLHPAKHEAILLRIFN
jgi:hypothetical protein